MNGGKKQGKAHIVRTYQDKLIIVQIGEEYDTELDGTDLRDNNFGKLDLIPEDLGLYEIEFEYSWHDGTNGVFEPSDPDSNFTVISVKTISLIS